MFDINPCKSFDSIIEYPKNKDLPIIDKYLSPPHIMFLVQRPAPTKFFESFVSTLLTKDIRLFFNSRIFTNLLKSTTKILFSHSSLI